LAVRIGNKETALVIARRMVTVMVRHAAGR